LASSRGRGEWPWALTLAASVLFVVTVLFRYLALPVFLNDQFEHLAGAQQMLFGEWPTRDFLDPGMPLMYAVSAGAQLLFGRTLFAEAVLNFSMLGVVSVSTVIGAYRLSRSLLIAVAVTVLTILIFPRPYTYPRLLMTAVGPLVMWGWLARPTLMRIAGLAVTVVVAFLFRYDLGAYIGVGAVMTLCLAPADNWRDIAKRLAVFGGLVLLMVTPYALFLGGYGAFGESVLRFVTYGRRHSARTALSLNHLGTVYHAGLFWGFHFAPVVALITLIVEWNRRRTTASVPVILPLTVVALVANRFLIADTLVARLPDAVVPNALLYAWVAGQVRTVVTFPVRVMATAAGAVAVVACAAAMSIVESIPEQINRTGVTRQGLQAIPELLLERTTRLNDRFSGRRMPPSGVLALVPFFEYLDRCATREDRLFVAGYAREIYVYARHPFGGGEKVFLRGSFASSEDQQYIVDRLTRQRVLFALTLDDVFETWRDGFPDVGRFLMTHFMPFAEVVAPNRTIRILANSAIRPHGTDEVTGWPCYL